MGLSCTLFLLCWGTFLLYLICWEFLSWNLLNFVKLFSAFIQMLWLLYFILLIQCITFTELYVEPSFLPRDKFYLIMVCGSFSVLWIFCFEETLSFFLFFFFIPYLGYSLPGIPNTILNCSLGNLLLGSVRWPISCYSEAYLVTVPPGIIMLSHFGHVQLLAIYGAIACQEPLFMRIH